MGSLKLSGKVKTGKAQHVPLRDAAIQSNRIKSEDPYIFLWRLCMVTHIARVWINRVRLPILHVVS